VLLVCITEGMVRGIQMERELGLCDAQPMLSNPVALAAYKKLGAPPPKVDAKPAAGDDASGATAAKRGRTTDAPTFRKAMGVPHFAPAAPLLAGAPWGAYDAAAYGAAVPRPQPAPLGPQNWGQQPAWHRPGIGAGKASARCRHCDQLGHYARECPNGGATQIRPAAADVTGLAPTRARWPPRHQQ
jgi:hypothetical protein